MKDESNHKIFLLVGPSGAGKSAIIEGLINKIPGLKRLPSFTTRHKRRIEEEGREHLFVSIEKFKQLIKNEELLEYQEVYPGLFYGTPREITRQALQKNNLIKDIDVLGAQSLKKIFPGETVSIFVEPPNLTELKGRIKKRGHISAAEIKSRLKRVSLEMKNAHSADYRVINDKLPECTKEVIAIILSEISKQKQNA